MEQESCFFLGMMCLENSEDRLDGLLTRNLWSAKKLVMALMQCENAFLCDEHPLEHRLNCSHVQISSRLLVDVVLE